MAQREIRLVDNEYPSPSMTHPPIPLSDIALTGIFEISKILTSPARLEITLANVVNLLQSFLQMRNGVVSLLADDGVPDITVGVGWNEGSDNRYRARLPQKAIDQIVATAVPLVADNVSAHPMFTAADAMALGATDEIRVSFIGVPIRIDSRVVGTLSIDRVRDGRSHFRMDADVRFLTMVANLIGQTVKLHRVVARDRERLERERKRVKVDGIVGESPAIRKLLAKVSIIAKSQSPVLLRGESGTGKELIAKAIHELSARANGPFIKINCAALPESVLESELFGHEKGAFTGAIASRKGRFELADKGTLFLDEIGEISASFQAKLLRVLQEQEFERVGGNQTIKVNVRIVAATNRNLEEAVARKEFRADLYYRINVVPMILPPLRDRPSDIPLLASEFLKNFNKENGRELAFESHALDLLKACSFPGNVRELENCVRRTATLAMGPEIRDSDFACHQDECLSAILWKGHAEPAPERPRPEIPLQVLPRKAPVEIVHPREPVASADDFAPAPVRSEMPSDESNMSERERLINAMERAGWVQAKAARIRGLTPRQIGYALKKHNIELKHF